MRGHDDRRQAGLFTTDPMPFVALGALVLVVLAFGIVWLGGTLGAWASGAGWAPPPFGPAMILAAFQGPLWPGTPAAWTRGGMLVLTLLLAGAATAVGVWAVRRNRAAIAGLATAHDMRDFFYKARRTQARRLRPSLEGVPDKELDPGQVGLPLGCLAGAGQRLLASLEDVVLVIAGPRSGKTSRIVSELALEASGFLLVASARSDAYAITKRHRERRGHVALFDPQHIAHAPQRYWWDLLAMARTLEGARRLAMHLSKAEEDPNERGGDAFFGKAGRSTLVNLLHAAAISGRPLSDFLGWTSDQRDRTPAKILRQHGLPDMSDALERMNRLAQETQDGVFEHVRQSVQSLYDPQIQRWITPQPGCEQIVPAQWVGRTDTLYMLSKDGGGGAAGITAALTDACFRAGVEQAEATRGGRLDPPMLAILDEAANICKIEDLPKMYSYLGGYGINTVTILQSYKQGAQTWTRDGMDALWGAATIKTIGAGLDDYSFLDQISHLVGMRATVEESFTSSRGGPSSTRSKRRERVLDAADVREIDRGQALILGTSTRPALVDLSAWYEREDADTLKHDKHIMDLEIEADADRDMKESLADIDPHKEEHA